MSRRLTPVERAAREQELKAYHAAYRLANPDTRTYQERKQCKRLRLTNTYSRMLQRVQGRGTPRSGKIYRGLTILTHAEFMGWAECAPAFNVLFDAWVDSGYQRRLSPSIDRIDSTKGYEIDNMQWLTLSDNAKKVHSAA